MCADTSKYVLVKEADSLNQNDKIYLFPLVPIKCGDEIGYELEYDVENLSSSDEETENKNMEYENQESHLQNGRLWDYFTDSSTDDDNSEDEQEVAKQTEKDIPITEPVLLKIPTSSDIFSV